MEHSPPLRLARDDLQDQAFSSSMNEPPDDYFSSSHGHPENEYRQPYYEDEIEEEEEEEEGEGDHQHEKSRHGTPRASSPVRQGNERTRSLSPFSDDSLTDLESSEGHFLEPISSILHSGTMAERAERDGLSINVSLTADKYILGDGVASPPVQVWREEKTDLKEIGTTHLQPIHALEYCVNEMGEGKVVLFCPKGPLEKMRIQKQCCHVKRSTMSLKVLDKLVRNCPLIDDNLREVAVKLVATVGERFVRDSENGTYIEPGSVLRSIGTHSQHHGSRASSRHQQTDPVVFVASPYMAMKSLESHTASEDGEHHPQTLLQSLYGFDVVTNRDKHQVIRKMSACGQRDDVLYVNQMWCLLIGSNILITMSDQLPDDLLGGVVEKRTSGLEQPIIVRIIDQANRIHRILVPSDTSWVDFFRYTMVMVQGKVDNALNFELIDQEDGILTGEKWIEFMKSKMPRLHVFRLIEKKRPDSRHRGHAGRGSSYSGQKEVLMLDYQPRPDDMTDRGSTYTPSRALHDGDNQALVQRRNSNLYPRWGPRSLYRIQRTHSKTSTLQGSGYEDEQASIWDIRTVRSEKSMTLGSVEAFPTQRRRIEYPENATEPQEQPDQLSSKTVSNDKDTAVHNYSGPEIMSLLKSLERLLDGQNTGSRGIRNENRNGEALPLPQLDSNDVTRNTDPPSSPLIQNDSQKRRDQSFTQKQENSLTISEKTPAGLPQERGIISRQGTSSSSPAQGSQPVITNPTRIRIIDSKGRVIIEDVEEVTEDHGSDSGASYIDRSAQTTNITIDDVGSAVGQIHRKEAIKGTRRRIQDISLDPPHGGYNIPRAMRRPSNATSNDGLPRKSSYRRYRDWEYPAPRRSSRHDISNQRRPYFDGYDDFHDPLAQRFHSRSTRRSPFPKARQDVVQNNETRNLEAFWRGDAGSISAQSHPRRAVHFASEDDAGVAVPRDHPLFHWDSYTIARRPTLQGAEDETMIKLLNEIDAAVKAHQIGRYYVKAPKFTMEDFFSRHEFLDGILPDGDLNIARDDLSRLGVDDGLAPGDPKDQDDLSLSGSNESERSFGRVKKHGQSKTSGAHTPYPASIQSSEDEIHEVEDVATQHDAWPTNGEHEGSEWRHSQSMGMMSHDQLLMKRLVEASRQIIWSFTPKRGSSMIHILLKRFWGCVDTICRQLVWQESEHGPDDERAYFIRNFSSQFKNSDTDTPDSSSKKISWSDCKDCKSGKHYSTALQALDHLHNTHIECDVGCERPYDDPCYVWLHHISPSKDPVQISRDGMLDDVEDFITYLFAINKYMKELHIMVTNSGRDQPTNARVSRPPLSINIVHTFQQIIKVFVLRSKKLSLANRLLDASNSEPSDSRLAKRIQAKLDELKLEERDTWERTLDLLDSAKRDIFLSGNTSRDIEKLQPKTVGAEFLTLAFICVGQNLPHQSHSAARPYQKDVVMKIYKDYASRLHFQANQRPQKRVFLDIRDLKEELEALDNVLEHQQVCLIRFVNSVYPETLRFTTGTRVGQYKTESLYRDVQLRQLEVRRREVENMNTRSRILKEQVKQTIEILEEDHGKAIRVFTIVTLFFLPLSFVSSFLGMNTIDMRSTHYNQQLFWMTAIPVTVAVLALAFIYGYKGDDIRDWMVQRLQDPGSQYSSSTLSKADRDDDHGLRYSEGSSSTWQSMSTAPGIPGSNLYREYKVLARNRIGGATGGRIGGSRNKRDDWMRRQNTQDSLAPFRK
ncbi:hypothetical protein PT974_11672 [Cladobotryum mycophilum]|uniref:Mg2+ transporter n=1 Tax=Cladobotryum mycophilum TaxID=491253 RepID=A0ABR0S6W6_9HYPO